jgi:acetyltransferase-like isoleucine patch superfamily enzyme
VSDRFDPAPWRYWKEADARERAAQTALQDRLRDGGAVLGENVYVSPGAFLDTDALWLGDHSYIATHAYVTHELRAGANCTVNPFAIVRGLVRMGDGVRIGAHASVLGFNHSTGPERPVHEQEMVSAGVVIGDDVWIGSGAVVLDGVRIGNHAVLGAGAVITKDVADWSVMAGNPARLVRDRRDPVRSGRSIGRRLAAFAKTARHDAAHLLDRSWTPGAAPGGAFIDRPDTTPTVRAHCDAIEIADLLLGTTPGPLSADEHRRRLREWQDRRTGLVPQFGATTEPCFGHNDATYHVLAVGYALDLLRSCFKFPVRAVAATAAAGIVEALDALDWEQAGWAAGAWVDAWATALHWNRLLGRREPAGATEALFGRLAAGSNPATGLWSPPSEAVGLLQAVNGFYRLTRGSYAQFDVPVPSPRQAIDSVLEHAADDRWFADGAQTACNVLDVAHQLWLLRRQDPHRSTESAWWARVQLEQALDRWHDGAGMAFAVSVTAGSPGTTEHEPGLQGTEMWLAIIWVLADLVGESAALGFRPRGVHRPEPARHGLGV